MASSNHVFDFATYTCVDGPGECAAQMLVESPWQEDMSFAVLSNADASGPNLFAGSARSTSTDSCTEVPLTQRLNWIGTAVWLGSSSEVLVLDPVRNAIFSISTTGMVSQDKRGITLASQAPDSFLPGRLEKLKDGYLLTLVDPNKTVIVIDSTYRRRLSSGSLQNNPEGSKASIGSVTDLLITGNDLIAYGSLKPAKGTDAKGVPFSLGFIHARVQLQPWRISEVELLEPTADQKYYLLGHRYIASADSGIYFLAMQEGSARLYHYSGRGRSPRLLNAIPAPYASVPPIKNSFRGPTDAASLFLEVEASRMPAGLYGRGRFLYLLTREPSSRIPQSTEWRLHQIDPVKERVTATLRLPTSAHHLTIVPGKDAFYLIEKGMVEGPGQQAVQKMIVVPLAWIEQAEVSLLNERNTELVYCDTLRKPDRRGNGLD